MHWLALVKRELAQLLVNRRLEMEGLLNRIAYGFDLD
jgi:hypothetical protein